MVAPSLAESMGNHRTSCCVCFQKIGATMSHLPARRHDLEKCGTDAAHAMLNHFGFHWLARRPAAASETTVSTRCARVSGRLALITHW